MADERISLSNYYSMHSNTLLISVTNPNNKTASKQKNRKLNYLYLRLNQSS